MIAAGELERAQRRDMALFRARGGVVEIGATGRLKRQISQVAVMNAVLSEGREVLSADAEGYWKDQDRRYFGVIESPHGGARVMRNRFGRVSWRKVYR